MPIKDHKSLDENGLPKCRPVCGASCTINQELSEWVSSLLEASVDSQEQSESISTEDLMNKIDQLNEEWEKQGIKWGKGELFVGSLDATALYPSLDVRQCSKLCGEMLRESPLKVEGIDYTWAAMYVALTSEQWQINSWKMDHIIPYRRHINGSQPGITGVTDPMVLLR